MLRQRSLERSLAPIPERGFVFIVDPAACKTGRQRRLLQVRDHAMALTMLCGQRHADFPAFPAFSLQRRALKIMFRTVSDVPPEEVMARSRAAEGILDNSLEIYAVDIQGPGPALSKVSAMLKIESPAYVLTGQSRKVLNAQWRTQASEISVSTFIRGVWEDYLLGLDPVKLPPDLQD
jgi:hypothetical protein